MTEMTEKNILSLFSSEEQVLREVKKVIDYQHSDPEVLADEIREYVVTEHIEENFRKLMEWVETAAGKKQAEIGAWVSGFYGSGKSSFTKYLGYAFSRQSLADGRTYAELLADKIEDRAVAQQLKTLSKRMDAAVVMLDLATQNYGAKTPCVSEVLHRRVLERAGLCKTGFAIADFELKVRKDGRWDEFLAECQKIKGKSWESIQNKPLFASGALKQIAARMYPGEELKLYADKDQVLSAVDRAKAIIDVVRSTSGRENIFFVIDEVGNYIASYPNAILDMQGLMQNLVTLGDGKVFVFATAQQMVTETGKGAINSDLLYKLKDRFLFSVTLESDDIEEICYRRLLKKSPEGEAELRSVYGVHGPKLAAKTKLTDSKAFEAGLSETQFVNLYPFLPSQFKMLLTLLAELSRSTGGTGLRSAIKIVQDILKGGSAADAADNAVVRAPVGRLITAADFYDELRQDIDRSKKDLYRSAQRVIEAYRNEPPVCSEVAKALAVATLLPGFVATPANLAALLQKSVEAETSADEVERVLRKMASEPTIPVSSSSDGSYHYLNEKEEELDQRRRDYLPPSSDMTNRRNMILTEILEAFLRVTGSGLTCSACLKLFGAPAIIAAEASAPLRLEVAWADGGVTAPARLEEAVKESRRSQNTLILVADKPEDFDESLTEILKSEYMAGRCAADPSEFVSNYGRSQKGLADRYARELAASVRSLFAKGWLVKGGVQRAAGGSEEAFQAALRETLKDLADDVYPKHAQVGSVAVRQESALRVLGAAPGKPLDRKDDPLALIREEDGALALDERPAVMSVLSELEKTDEIRGGTLLEAFQRPPYGWSRDVTLYILAALFVCARIELNISGQIHRTRDKASEEAFASPKAFSKSAGVRKRAAVFTKEQLIACGNFLSVHGFTASKYTEAEILKTIAGFADESMRAADFLQHQVAEHRTYGREKLSLLKAKLDSLKDRGIEGLLEELKPESGFEECLKWFSSLKKAEKNGLFSVIRDAKLAGDELAQYISDPSSSGILNAYEELKSGLSQPSFAEGIVKCRQFIADCRKEKTGLVQKFRQELEAALGDFRAERDRAGADAGLDEDEKARLPQAPAVSVDADQPGQLMRSILQVNAKAKELAVAAKRIAEARTKPKEERAGEGAEVAVKQAKTFAVPARVTSAGELKKLIGELQQLEAQMDSFSEINFRIG